MTALFLRSIALWTGCAAITLTAADDSKTAEVFRAHSPDKKFAMRIVCEADFAKAEEIPAHAVRSVSLVALPSKDEVIPLLTDDGAFAGFGDLRLVWSADSQWCAFYSATNRVGYTTAFRRGGERFTQVGRDDLSAPTDVDKRNEHISPVRWVKPGVLLLDHHIVPRGEGEDFHAQFTATYDAKARKFRIGNVKKLAR